MFDSLGKLLLILLFPYLLGVFISILKALWNWKRHVVFFKSSSLLEKLCLAILAAFIVKLLNNSVNPNLSYFTLTNTNIDSPAYLLRNKFRDYIKSREEGDPSFSLMLAKRRAAIGDSLEEEVIDKVHTSFEALEREYIELEKLSMELRNNEKRRLYVLFGRESLNCSLCGASRWAQVALIAPTILKDYLLALFSIGMVSISPKKNYWRVISVILIILTISYEVYEWGFSENIIIELYSEGRGGGNFMTRPEQMTLVRNLVLLPLSILVFIFDFQVLEPPAVLTSLTLVIDSVEKACSKLQTSRLARMAIMNDDLLRKHCWEYYRKVENEKQHLFNDSKYKKIHLELSRKYNVDELLRSANDFTMEAFKPPSSSESEKIK